MFPYHILVLDGQGKPRPDRETICGIRRDSGVSFSFHSKPIGNNKDGFYCSDCYFYYMEDKNMRHTDQAIFDTDLDDLKNVKGHDIWDALYASYPTVSLRRRKNVINYLLNVQERGKPMTVTAEYFHRNELRPTEPIHIVDHDVKGVVTDVKKFGDVLFFSIDGQIYDLRPQSKISTWPAGAAPSVGVETKDLCNHKSFDPNWACEKVRGHDVFNRDVRDHEHRYAYKPELNPVERTITPKELYNNADRWRGRTIDYLGKAGVFTDIGFIGSDNVYHFILDGMIYGGRFDAELKIMKDQS